MVHRQTQWALLRDVRRATAATPLIGRALTTVRRGKGVRARPVEGAKAAASAAVGMVVEVAPAAAEVAPVAVAAASAAAAVEVALVVAVAEVALAAGVAPVVVAVAGEAPRGRSRIGLAPTWARGRSADRPTAIA